MAKTTAGGPGGGPAVEYIIGKQRSLFCNPNDDFKEYIFIFVYTTIQN